MLSFLLLLIVERGLVGEPTAAILNRMEGGSRS